MSPITTVDSSGSREPRRPEILARPCFTRYGSPARIGITEELAPQDFGRQGRAVEREERSVAARPLLMDRPGHEPLAGTRFAHDQDRDGDRGRGGHLFEDAAMDRPAADQGLESVPREQTLANLHQLGPEPLGHAVGNGRGKLDRPDDAEKTERIAVGVEHRPVIHPPPFPFAAGVDDQGGAPQGRPARASAGG